MENKDINENDKLIQDILNAKNNVNSTKKDNEPNNNISQEEPMQQPETDEIIELKEVTPKMSKRKKKKSRKKLITGLILTVIIVTIAVFSALMIIKVGKDVLGIEKADKEIVFDIKSGTSTSELAEQLKASNVIEYPLVFRLFSRMQSADSTYIAGEHKINTNMGYESIIIELQSDAISDETVDVTFPEGYTIDQCAKVLEKNGVCKADEFIKTFNSSKFGYDFEKQISENPLKLYKMEGYLFPDTYTFFVNSDVDKVVKKIYENFEIKVDPNMYGRMNELGLTLEQTITIASIVQAEAPESSQMKNVSSVFLNRLNNAEEFPKLQSDPTTKYVNEVILVNNPTASEEICTAYDTYKGQGLPPGAIGNPGIDAIKAVLYSSDTDFYFFCSNLDTHEFFYAETDAQHEKNLVKAGLK
ncbi:MAG: endolytic transglycosylase MltG [Oscillospiraceae bacterium]